MRTNKRIILYLAAFCVGVLTTLAADQPLYENNFEKAEVGKLPNDFLVLDGEFAVKEEGTNKFLELPGAPLDSFGAQFGPSVKDNVTVSARIFGTAKGRRVPTFGVGLGGVTGYRLQVSPGKDALEIFKDQDMKASVPCTWQSDTWTMLRLQITKLADGGWKIEGKIWLQGTAEPNAWMISFVEKSDVTAGRASVSGSPISGKPIRFDDVRVEAIAQSKSEQLMK